ncbi:MAG TPA: hypothetical protein VFM46_04910 [Pseudomonadales bacterium]|nr:hypothetical protein [Pseudomonadales bacterium]
MKAQLMAWLDKINALSLRERMMITAAVLAVFGMIWNFLLLTPAQAEIKMLATKNNETLAEIATLAEQRVQLLEHPPVDPNDALKSRLADTTQGISEIDKQLHGATTDLISSQRMVEVLRALVSNQGLELISVKSLPVIPIVTQTGFDPAPAKTENVKSTEAVDIHKSTSVVADAVDRALGKNHSLMGNKDAATATEKEKPHPTLFRHGLEIQMRGGFSAILSYLRATENLPWRLYWDTLEYKVETYPNAKIVLRVYTLSVDEGWIGV